MAKREQRRALPSTPRPEDSAAQKSSVPGHGDRDVGLGRRSLHEDDHRQGHDGTAKQERLKAEAPHVIKGTKCNPAHVKGRELDAGRLGQVPSKRMARIGFGLVVWCIIGIGFVADGQWVPFAIQVVLVWLLFSAVVQWRAGHRGRCWRTRAWRHAWGGLVPTSDLDPTRPA